MAIVKEMADREEFQAWLATRPESVQKLVAALPPDRLYRIKDTGHRGTIHSYSEDGTVTLHVTGEYNRVLFSRGVFGLKPEQLEECDLPGPGEDLGDTSQEAGYSQEDVRNILLPKIREDMKRRGLDA